MFSNVGSMSVRATTLEDVPFRLLLVATWAATWGAKMVVEAVETLAGGGFTAYLFALAAGVLGTVVLSLAVLLFTGAPFVRSASVVAFAGLAAVTAVRASPADLVAVAAVALHLGSAAVLVLTKEFFRSERSGPPDESGTRIGV